MPRYSAQQIYGFARQAGFLPDQAATMTAVALAESNGNSSARNRRGENSRGLWQINAAAHPGLVASLDLYDPLQNAKAAFEISQGGRDISSWTTTHGGYRARYLRHRDDAEAAAAVHGDGRGRGVWTGTNGYGDPSVNMARADGGAPALPTARPADDHGIPVFEAAGADRAGADHGIPRYGGMSGRAADIQEGADSGIPLAPTPAAVSAPAPDATSSPEVLNDQRGPDAIRTRRFLDAALSQAGDPYIFGAQTSMQDRNPRAFDCSELTRWAAAQAGVTIPDGTWLQYLSLKTAGNVVSVEAALRTPGALLFSFSEEPTPQGSRPRAAHVAISLGDGTTIEAKGTRYGVGSWEATSKRFQYAAVIPGLSCPEGSGRGSGHDGVGMQEGPGEISDPASRTSGDADRDGLTDALERRLGLDPHRMDTDRDSIADSEGLLRTRTDPRLADTHWHMRSDAAEIQDGDDRNVADGDDGHLDGSQPESWTDTEEHRLDHDLERALRLSPNRVDAAGDGYTDRLEHDLGSDATSFARVPSAGQSASWAHDESGAPA